MSKRLGLGIDTGGTYTDACLFDFDTHEVVGKAKARTTYHDLAIGITEAVAALRGSEFQAVELVSLSTTLATNAMVEGRGGQECLLLLGYERELMERLSEEAGLQLHERVYFIEGKFDILGRELVPLDLAAARRAILEVQGKVDAIGISGYLSVVNPSHELAVKRLVEELAPLPVTCGHELTAQLNSVKRAATVALNARLVPIIKRLIVSVQQSLEAQGIAAPLVVVQGDGSLVRAGVAVTQPVQTILSGPAASCVGGAGLSGQRSCIVVDTGGTTTDIAVLEDGVPELDASGAQVGSWKTSVSAVKVRTTGFGGDSHIQVSRNLEISIGPRRVIPLCIAAARSANVKDEIRRLAQSETGLPLVQLFDFLTVVQDPDSVPLAEQDAATLAELAYGPLSLYQLAERRGISHPLLLDVSRLEHLGFVGRVGLTPTDIMHAAGQYTAWDTEAARLAVNATAKLMGLSSESFIERVETAISRRLALELLSKLAGTGCAGPVEVPGCQACQVLVDLALEHTSPRKRGGLACHFTLDRPIVALGAPRDTYLNRVAALLGTSLIVPPHAEVANAVGAITGNVIRTVRCQIIPIYGLTGVQGFRLAGTEAPREFGRLEDAIRAAATYAEQAALEQARAAGAERVGVKVDCTHKGQAVHLETLVTATAIGRPELARIEQTETV